MKKLIKSLYSLLALVLFAGVGIAIGLYFTPVAGTGEAQDFMVSTNRTHDPLGIAVAAIASSEKSVVISTRMLDHEPIIRELIAARARGVQISILLTNPSIYTKTLPQAVKARYQDRFRTLRDSRIGNLYLTNVVNFITFITIDEKVTIDFSAPIDSGTYNSQEAYIGFDVHLGAAPAQAYFGLFRDLITDAARVSS